MLLPCAIMEHRLSATSLAPSVKANMVSPCWVVSEPATKRSTSTLTASVFILPPFVLFQAYISMPCT